MSNRRKISTINLRIAELDRTLLDSIANRVPPALFLSAASKQKGCRRTPDEDQLPVDEKGANRGL